MKKLNYLLVLLVSTILMSCSSVPESINVEYSGDIKGNLSYIIPNQQTLKIKVKESKEDWNKGDFNLTAKLDVKIENGGLQIKSMPGNGPNINYFIVLLDENKDEIDVTFRLKDYEGQVLEGYNNSGQGGELSFQASCKKDNQGVIEKAKYFSIKTRYENRGGVVVEEAIEEEAIDEAMETMVKAAKAVKEITEQ